MKSREFLKQATAIELHTVNKVLEPVGVQADSFEMPSAYDRQQADGESAEEINEAMLGDKQDVQEGSQIKSVFLANKAKVAATAKNIHEANRFRRDYNIIIAGHKQLLTSIYRTMYQRKLKLEHALEANDA